MVYFDQPWLTIHWDEPTQVIWLEWKGYAEGAEFRSSLEQGLLLMRKMGASRWLTDLRRAGPVSQADQKWGNEDWFPRVTAAGLRFMAMVSPQSAVSRLSMKQILNRVNGTPVISAHFDNLPEAWEWLRSQKTP